jgi:hypothetical protein
MLWLLLVTVPAAIAGCGAGTTAPHTEEAEEAIARTEFTDRIENFFEYSPLKAGKPSQFLIHLTDLTDGSPVEKADVVLVTRSKDGSQVAETKARIGKVTGIYVVDLALPRAGTFDIEFRVRNEKIDERMTLADFVVE